MRRKGDTADLAIAKIAARQYGVVSVTQLQVAGLSEAGVRRRVYAGRLLRVHRGIYAVGHSSLSREGRWIAAVFAYGPTAVLSHRSAAVLWGLLTPREEAVNVLVPGVAGKGRHSGIRLHRSRTLTSAQTTRRHNIPVTTPARTIDDLRRTASAADVRRAIRQAAVLGLRVGLETTPDRTRSELEHSFLQLCKRHGLPKPEVNARVGSLEVDFLWPDRRLIVETDGYRYHRGRAAFENDRERDLRLHALGYDVVRLSYRQVIDEPEQVAAALKHR